MSIGTDILLLVALILLIIVSAFFSSSETGMMSMNRYRLKHLANEGNRTAHRAYKLLERPDRLLGIILIGNTLANILASSLATFLAVRWWGNVGVAIATAVLTFFILIFAETLPKTFAAVHSQKITFFVTWPLSLLLWICYPLVWTMNFIVNHTLGLFKIHVGKKGAEHLSPEELRTVVYESAGIMPIRHREMLLGLLDLESITVEDIMLPRNEIIGIDLDDEWEDILEMLGSFPHERLPLYQGSVDNVLGVIEVQLLIGLSADNKLSKDKLGSIALPAYFVPSGTSVLRQIANFQKERRRYALVVDEYGDILGSITLADIFEEIVGEFILDADSVSQDIHPQEDGSYFIDGSITLRELNKAMHWNLPLKGPKTLSGLIIEKFEDIPQAKASIKIENLSIEVLQVRDNRVKTARVMVLESSRP